MFNIVRKATGKVYGRDVPAVSVNLVLSAMPSGVYSIVDFDGIEVNLATQPFELMPPIEGEKRA